ncbi:unnamed protein product [Rhizoctonia solani]|uniref:Jacalin-type lectin domain-containing protein n=1 Tax=Rhizoctonia solani TaxID=456999 RepID=A0A8H2WQW0_9AGAM|nr:unnamed protein product [Rhizoctonia solani]
MTEHCAPVWGFKVRKATLITYTDSSAPNSSLELSGPNLPAPNPQTSGYTQTVDICGGGGAAVYLRRASFPSIYLHQLTRLHFWRPIMLWRSISLPAAVFLCAAATTNSTEQRNAISGTFNVLSMSVNGLPTDFFPKYDPKRKENTKLMALAMSRYDYGIINVQKGFTFMRVRIDEGVYIDMINLHTNTGVGLSDQAARRSNIRQVADYISANSAGNAVIVFGNTNSRYTRSEDNLDFLTGQNGLTDAWVQAIGGRTPAAGSDALICPRIVPLSIKCEAEDKVLYRGSPAVHLNSTGFFYDTARFMSPENSMLSDHHPVRVEFRYELKHGMRQSDLYGGPHGTWFNDISSIDSSSRISFITLCGVGYLEGLILRLESGTTFTHGLSNGFCYPLNLDPKDYVTSVKLCWEKVSAHTRIFYAQVTTNTGRLRHAGIVTHDCAVANAPVGYGVAGTYGQAGYDSNRLGIIYQLGFIYTAQNT